MKRFFPLFMLGVIAVMSFAACGEDGGTSTAATSQPPASVASVPATSTPAPASTPSEASTPASTPAQDPSTDEPALGDHALEEILTTVSEAAGISATIPVTELDLRAGGVDPGKFDSFVGVESQTSSQDGGIVIVFSVKDGMQEALADEMIAFRDSRVDDRYAEFAEAMEHTQNAGASYNGNVLIYAVSASGDYQALNDAISGILAQFTPDN
ncbi:MAG: hypothetical protein AB7V55_04330 [Oscillospiraceae bacterium]